MADPSQRARVTCVDVSSAYLRITAKRFESVGLPVTMIPGYMDDLPRLTDGKFFGVFCHVSWYYCMNDFLFASRILESLCVGGVAFIRSNTEGFETNRSWKRELIYWLNNRFALKVGHPHPARGRITAAFSRVGGCDVAVDYSEPDVDVVIARKC